MFQFCLHFIYFGDRVSLGWSQTSNLSFQSPECFKYRCALFSSSVLWECLYRQAWRTCVPLTFSPVFWADCRASSTTYLAGTCVWAPGLWTEPLNKCQAVLMQMSQGKSQLCEMVSYCALAPDHSKCEMTKYPTPSWKWLHCHRTSLHHGILS